MDLFIYSDESGVFDKEHNKIFVFGGLIFLGKKSKDNFARKYIAAENTLRKNKYSANEELKACRISNKEKGKLYRSMNGAIRFGVIINQQKILSNIFQSKKDKQRYLDYTYKIGVKQTLQKLVKENVIIPDEVGTIHFYNDEHNTATNGIYELREGLEQELKNGTYNMTYDIFFPPIFEKMKGIELQYCNSKKVHLIRAADIVANRIYYMALNNNIEDLNGIYLTIFP